MRPEREVITLVKLQQDYYADRPLMNKHNSDLAAIVEHLLTEITELNGHAEKGMTLEKYREQEVADIVWFAFATLHQFGQYPTPDYLENVVSEFDLKIPSGSWSDPQPFSQADEQMYLQIKHELEKHATDLTDAIKASQKRHVLVMNKAERQFSIEKLHRILGLCWAIFALLKINPYDAAQEKMARNVLKHYASAYANTKDDYGTVRARLNQEWDEQQGTEEFYGSMTSVARRPVIR